MIKKELLWSLNQYIAGIEYAKIPKKDWATIDCSLKRTLTLVEIECGIDFSDERYDVGKGDE